MSGITSLGGVGAGLGEARFQVQYRARVLKEQQNVTKDLGSAAIQLVRAAMAAANSLGNDLDVRA